MNDPITGKKGKTAAVMSNEWLRSRLEPKVRRRGIQVARRVRNLGITMRGVGGKKDADAGDSAQQRLKAAFGRTGRLRWAKRFGGAAAKVAMATESQNDRI